MQGIIYALETSSYVCLSYHKLFCKTDKKARYLLLNFHTHSEQCKYHFLLIDGEVFGLSASIVQIQLRDPLCDLNHVNLIAYCLNVEQTMLAPLTVYITLILPVQYYSIIIVSWASAHSHDKRPRFLLPYNYPARMRKGQVTKQNLRDKKCLHRGTDSIIHSSYNYKAILGVVDR